MFKAMKKEKTTEPKVELKLKKGGKAKMAMGGMPMVEPPMRSSMPEEVMPMERKIMPKRAMQRMPMKRSMAMQPALLTRKNGGEMESPKGHKAEMKEMGKIEKELKSHEGKPASKAHKGLKAGGTLSPKINVQDKVVGAKQTKSFNTKTSGVQKYKTGGLIQEYAKGGTVSESVASRYVNKINDGSNPSKKIGKTGEIKQQPAGYKNGGHVAMTCKSEGGYTQMKKMSKC